MLTIKIGYEWLDRLIVEGFPIPSSTLISGPGGSGKPLVGFFIVSSWLKHGGNLVFVPLQYPSREFSEKALRSVGGIEMKDYADRVAFIQLDPTISTMERVNEDTIKANLLKPDVWDAAIREADRFIAPGELGTMVFGSALNLLLFSRTYKDAILERMRRTIAEDKSRTYLFTVSTSAFKENIRVLEDAADNLMFTRVERPPMRLYLTITRMKGVKFLEKEAEVPLSPETLAEVREVAERSRKRIIPLVSRI